jgi:hypothetical protein
VVEILPTINQTSAAGYTGLKLNVTETAVGSGEKKLIDLQVGGISKFSVNNLGAIDVTDAATTRNNLGIYSGILSWDSNGATDGFGNAVADEESTILLPSNIILSLSSIVILTMRSNTSGNVAVVQDVVNVVNPNGDDSITVTINQVASDNKITFNYIIIQ